MDTEAVTVVDTSEGYKVYLKTSFSRVESKLIKGIVRKYISVDPLTQKPNKVTMEDLYQASREVTLRVITKILLPDGSEASDIAAAFDNLSEEDEEVVLKKADEITKASDISKKNETTSITNAS